MPTLNWIGKEAVEKHHEDVPYRLLEPVSELSCGEPDSGNLIVQGDNLHALKALLPRYGGKVKCIYIDPPYNTGNEEWSYNDNVNSPEIRKWLGQIVDKEGETLDRHDRWLCMMYPRLLLLKKFLRKDGVIFISIDDQEVGFLKILCDDIFGRKNFITMLVWNSEGNTDNQFEVKVNHEYVLMYVANASYKSEAIGRVVDPNTREDSNLWAGLADNNINKNNPANPPSFFEIPEGFPSIEESFFYAANKRIDEKFFEVTKKEKMITDSVKEAYGIEARSGMPVKVDDLLVDNYKVVKKCRVYGGFANRKKLEQFVLNGFNPVNDEGGPMSFYVNANAAIRYRRIVDSPRNILSVLRGFGTTEQMRGELKRMGVAFTYPKPVELIKYLLKVGGVDRDDTVLDSFAGSGTTAHSVLSLNADDCGERKFILVEMDSDICKKTTLKRLRSAILGYTDTRGAKISPLGSGFQYCTLSEEPLFMADGEIRPDVTFAQLAEFVWFGETGTGYTGKADSPLLGVHDGRAIYLLYNGILKDLTTEGGNVLTSHVYSVLPKYDGAKVIYAAANRLGAKAKRENITFKQTPYKLEV